MSNDPQDGIRSELIVTKALLEGSFPVLSSTGASEGGQNYGPFLKRGTSSPVIETRYTCRSFDNEGNTMESVPPEAKAAMDKFVHSAERLIRCMPDQQSTSVEKPKWKETYGCFSLYTSQCQENQLDQLSDIMHATEEDKPPFTYRVHSSVEDYLEDGGEMRGPEDRPSLWDDYKDRLEREYDGSRYLDELCEESPGTVKIVFTTNIEQPTRLTRTVPSSSSGGDDPTRTSGWKVLDPEFSVSCKVMDDCPKAIREDKGALAVYKRSIYRQIESLVHNNNIGSHIQLGDDTTVKEFYDDTKKYEQHLYLCGGHITSNAVSFFSAPELPAEDEVSEDTQQAVDGHLVKAAWVSPTMYAVLEGQPSEDRLSYSKKISEYESTIAEGLATMRGTVVNRRSPNDENEEAQPKDDTWGTWLH
ncbi:hypothetical protein B9479_005402 [Cryptococcus floricola]|uniref:Uncharacterized protein n=1 Tax=Cryptococcus floricola TaxID=2591691 RepID=A0A5D3AR06_9TREE|nr:hypothetical protein B9479_005402 [Cryptococcus floricola]